MERVSGVQFAVFRVCFGLSLALSALGNAFRGGEVVEGDFLHPALLELSRTCDAIFRGVWWHAEISPLGAVQGGALVFLALCIAAGLARRVAAAILILFAFFSGAFGGSVLILASLVVLLVVPEREPGVVSTKFLSWNKGHEVNPSILEACDLRASSFSALPIARLLPFAAWGVVVSALTISGVAFFLELRMQTRVSVRELHSAVESVLVLQSGGGGAWQWSFVALSLLSLPLALFRWGRAVVWIFSVFVAALGSGGGGVPFLLLAFDSRWCPPRRDGKQRTVFFDGECGLCHRGVFLLQEMDTAKVLTFSPLQGRTAAESLPEHLRRELSTVVYLRGEKSLTHSGAILAALSDVGGFARLLSLGRVFPPSLRDTIYRFLSRHRERVKCSPCESVREEQFLE